VGAVGTVALELLQTMGAGRAGRVEEEVHQIPKVLCLTPLVASRKKGSFHTELTSVHLSTHESTGSAGTCVYAPAP
jgi:hypothetical protein